MVQNNEVNTAQKNFSGILVSMMEDYKGSKDVSGDKLSAFILNQIEKQKIFETREAAEIATSEMDLSRILCKLKLDMSGYSLAI